MAKKNNQRTAQQRYNRQLFRDLSALEREILAIFSEATREAAAVAALLGEIKPDTLFSFDDYPITRKRVETLLNKLKSGLSVAIVDGIHSAWTLANNKNNELANVVFGDNVGKLSEAQYSRYYGTNETARDAFAQRRVEGLNLSDRVWRYTNQFKEEIELGIDCGLRDGLSADEMSRQLRSYLQQPDKLFRRVRDEHGQLQLSKRAAAYHPGRGVYRSSYKNARRLAVSEGNIAFHTADHLRWQQLDFVVGIEIRLSNNHTLNGLPFHDICDELAGRYPKDFKFTGWHPHCRCSAITILKTEEELQEDTRRIMAGEELDGKSSNRVDDVPPQFKKWLEDNEERAQRSYSMPYFIKDNGKYLPKGYKNLYAMKMPYDNLGQYRAAMTFNKKYANFSEAVKANNKELSGVLPVIQGKVMNITEADGGLPNPKYTVQNAVALGFHHNCQTCTMCYELRRRGFPVEAKPNPLAKGYKKMRDFERFCSGQGVTWQDRFLTIDGKSAKYEWSRTLTDKTLKGKRAFIEAKTSEQGRYEVYCAWEKGGGAHVFTVERQKNGDLLWYDPQTSRRGSSFDDYIDRMKPESIGVMRIDDKLVNPKFADRLIKAGE